MEEANRRPPHTTQACRGQPLHAASRSVNACAAHSDNWRSEQLWGCADHFKYRAITYGAESLRPRPLSKHQRCASASACSYGHRILRDIGSSRRLHSTVSSCCVLRIAYRCCIFGTSEMQRSASQKTPWGPGVHAKRLAVLPSGREPFH